MKITGELYFSSSSICWNKAHKPSHFDAINRVIEIVSLKDDSDSLSTFKLHDVYDMLKYLGVFVAVIWRISGFLDPIKFLGTPVV